MSKAPTLTDRFHYAFDTLMARGAWVLIGWHLVAAMAAVIVVALVVAVVGLTPVDESGAAISFGELIWVVLMHAIDPGTITGDEGGRAWRGVMMFATVLGILLVGSLVAVLVASVAGRFDSLRRGRSRVLEHDHTLVLGWSRQIFTIIAELSVAREGRDHCVVVCSEHDKVWMEEELRDKIGRPKGLRLVVRSGDITDPDMLSRVAIEQARSILVLSPESDTRDTNVIRTLLAIGRTPADEGRVQHVVTEIHEPSNLSVARLTGERRIEALVVGDLIAKIAVQTCLQSGLSVVYEELLGFDGSELYFIADPQLVGQSFARAVHHYEDAAVLGVRKPDGSITLKPPLDSTLAAGDRLVAIANSDHPRASGWSGALDESGIAESKPTQRAVKRTLILGWNARVPAIITGIDAYVIAGSEICVVSVDNAARLELAELGSTLEHATLTHQFGNVADRKLLDSLDPNSWHHVMVLPPDRLELATEADAQVLIALLHLRNIAEASARPFSVVSEMRDVRSRDLAEVARADDFIISDRFLGLLLAQVSENPDLSAVFGELFDPEGCEIYLRPATDYVVADRELDYHVLVEAGLRRGEVVIGYRLAREAQNPKRAFGVVVNPAKSERIKLGAQDRVIVLADE
jgi:voltage-gated potassium channel Kch